MFYVQLYKNGLSRVGIIILIIIIVWVFLSSIDYHICEDAIGKHFLQQGAC